MVDLVAAPRTWKGILVVLVAGFAILFWFAATGLIVWLIVVAFAALVAFVLWLIIRGLVYRGDRRLGGAR